MYSQIVQDDTKNYYESSNSQGWKIVWSWILKIAGRIEGPLNRKTISKTMDQSKTDVFHFSVDHFLTCSTRGKPILVLHFVPLGGTCVEGASCHGTVELCETDFRKIVSETCMCCISPWRGRARAWASRWWHLSSSQLPCDPQRSSNPPP